VLKDFDGDEKMRVVFLAQNWNESLPKPNFEPLQILIITS
jgi:hypothetical protein